MAKKRVEDPIHLNEIGVDGLQHIWTIFRAVAMGTTTDESLINLVNEAKQAELHRDTLLTYLTNIAHPEIDALQKYAREQEQREFPKNIVDRLLAFSLPKTAIDGLAQVEEAFVEINNTLMTNLKIQ